MCGEFGEVTVIIGLVINFLAFVSPLCAFRDTSSYVFGDVLQSAKHRAYNASSDVNRPPLVLTPFLNCPAKSKAKIKNVSCCCSFRNTIFWRNIHFWDDTLGLSGANLSTIIFH